jgi:hypothetical protein
LDTHEVLDSDDRAETSDWLLGEIGEDDREVLGNGRLLNVLVFPSFSVISDYRFPALFSLILVQFPVKPPTKEPTEQINLVLHSNVRTFGRAKFDHQVVHCDARSLPSTSS